eukprot:1447046-Pyramimonas_sp.AAC.1
MEDASGAAAFSERSGTLRDALEGINHCPSPTRPHLRSGVAEKSHQPSGRRWFNTCCLLPAKKPSFPCSGEGFTSPPALSS